jgi:hypothetical protein
LGELQDFEESEVVEVTLLFGDAVFHDLFLSVKLDQVIDEV